MKKLIVICAVFTAFLSRESLGQEFGLKVSFFRGAKTVANKIIAFGYDAGATDTLEGPKSWYTELGGEQLTPPPGFDWDFRFTGNYIGRYSDLHEGSYVDIRKKPTSSSFRLQYEIDMIENDSSMARIEWDNSLIPAIVKHITLASNQDTAHPLLDMKTTSSYTFPTRNSIEHYGSMILNLYYNSDPADVGTSIRSSSQGLTVYPNPVDSRSKLHFVTGEDGKLMLSAYDITGKKIFERSVNAFAGENSVAIGEDGISSHPGVYFFRLSGALSGKSYERSAVVIVR